MTCGLFRGTLWHCPAFVFKQGQDRMLDFFSHDFIQPFTYITWQIALLRLTMACLLGGLIGLEREFRDRPAGLRTHMMISLAACLFTLISFDLMTVPVGNDQTLSGDPLRLISAVTSGVAFLAAGSIITQGRQVRGLTTGAGMWLAGAIGLTCGIGNLWLATMAAVLALIVLWIIGTISNSVERDDG